MSTGISLTPEAVNIVNSFDYFGMVLGLPRLPGEDNITYKKRLLDVYVNRANATETGLTNGITRELGLEQFDAITISSSSSNSPRVIVKDTKIELYSKWIIDEYGEQEYTLEETIDTYSIDSSAYFVPGLISAINATSSFSAVAVDTIGTDTLSATLINTDSRKWQDNELIKPLRKQRLEYSNIVQGMIYFSIEGRNVFANRKASEAAVVSSGDYYIDYTNGYLVSYDLPSGTIYCRYMYDELPLTLKGSPVILHEFFADDFLDKIFYQITQEDGTTIEGLPKDEAVSFIQELHSAKGMLWGS